MKALSIKTTRLNKFNMKHNQLSGHGRLNTNWRKKASKGVSIWWLEIRMLMWFLLKMDLKTKRTGICLCEHIQNSLPICNLCNEKKSN
jgi:hypothetical protein